MISEDDYKMVLEGPVKQLTKMELRLMMSLYRSSGNLAHYPLTFKKLYDYYTLAAELGYYDKNKNPGDSVQWIMNNFKELLKPGSEKEIRRMTDLYFYKKYWKRGEIPPGIKNKTE